MREKLFEELLNDCGAFKLLMVLSISLGAAFISGAMTMYIIPDKPIYIKEKEND